MAEKRDYYEVLGIDKSASEDDIKRAYKKAALKWHPDRWVSGTDDEKKTAEEKFKEASEAYSVLSEPDKKARYDKFGHAGVDGAAGGGFGGGFDFSGMNLNDLLNSLFGGGFSGFSGFGGFGGFGGQQQNSGQARVFKGRSIQTSVKLTLEEIAKGVKKDITIERMEPCETCGSKGAKDASDIKTCPTCNGTGQYRQVISSIFGQQVNVSTCSQCNGTGQVISKPCPHCGGKGTISRKRTITVDIPAGVENGMQVTIKGEGHAAKNNGINGDLIVVIKEQPHPTFLRDGQNLFCTQTISVTDAMLGTKLTIPCLGGKYEVKIEPGTQSGTIIKLKGMGLPAVSGYGRGIGDLYVKILVWIPRKLKRDEKEALEKMRSSGSFTPDLSREDKALFEKMKENF